MIALLNRERILKWNVGSRFPIQGFYEGYRWVCYKHELLHGAYHVYHFTLSNDSSNDLQFRDLTYTMMVDDDVLKGGGEYLIRVHGSGSIFRVK